MWIIWPLILGLGYYLLPLCAVFLWLRRIWQLRSGALRAGALAVVIIILSTSLNRQIIPSYNGYGLFILALVVFLPYFLPTTPQARPYRIATQVLLLSMSLALHLWYAYLYEIPQFDNSFSYYVLPCLSLSFGLGWLAFTRLNHQGMRLLSLVLALGIGFALGQFFYLNA